MLKIKNIKKQCTQCLVSWAFVLSEYQFLSKDRSKRYNGVLLGKVYNTKKQWRIFTYDYKIPHFIMRLSWNYQKLNTQVVLNIDTMLFRQELIRLIIDKSG